ncbi:hypothetical protein BD779DRAFT_1485450 [Infundibulicybe gibba]|nr:hypothetical protein BD779DRAFT_1485450 [Infundibulicybe gibba]
MSTYSNLQTPRLGGSLAVIVFVFTLLAFVSETQLTQYVQSTLGYRQPFFLFYVVHSSLWIILPVHLWYLTLTTKYSMSAYLKGLTIAITNHLSPREISGSSKFPQLAFFRLVLALTTGVTLPGLLWFASVSLASISDVTAIWNTNAFFAYIFTVKVFHLHWESRRLAAVLLATLGPRRTGVSRKPSAPVVGNLLTLVASIIYGLYQVLYKRYAALPSDPEVVTTDLYQQISHDDSATESYGTVGFEEYPDAVYPPPFGLHPNMLTSAIGFCTLIILWIPLPILHLLNIEHFVLPPNAMTTLAIVGIALSGVVFNAGFMVLLGVWGPVITSVGNLLTIALVFFSDITFGTGAQSITFWSTLGSSVIVAAFGVLAYDVWSKGS